MQPLVTTLAGVAGLWVGGCASDTPPAEVLQEHFQRGAAGEGQLGPIDRGDDPFINPREGDTTPGHP